MSHLSSSCTCKRCNACVHTYIHTKPRILSPSQLTIFMYIQYNPHPDHTQNLSALEFCTDVHSIYTCIYIHTYTHMHSFRRTARNPSRHVHKHNQKVARGRTQVSHTCIHVYIRITYIHIYIHSNYIHTHIRITHTHTHTCNIYWPFKLIRKWCDICA